MTSEKISLKEKYILEEDKEDFFKTLVKNSETYMVMRINDHLAKYGLDLPADSQKELENVLNQRSFKVSERKKIEFKRFLLELESTTDQTKLKKLIKDFNTKFLSKSFNFHRPANVKQSQGLKAVGEKTIGSTLSKETLLKTDFEASMQTFFNQSNHKTITKFNSSSFPKFDLKRLLDKHTYCFEYVSNVLSDFSHVKDYPKYLKSYVKEKRKYQKNFHPVQTYYDKMTLAQLEVYKSLFPDATKHKNFIISHFRKTFEISPGQFPVNQDNLEEYRETLIRMLKWTERMGKVFSNFPAQILMAILDNGIKIGNFDKSYFLAYVQNPPKVIGCFNKKQRKVLNKRSNHNYDTSWHSVHNIKEISSLNGDVICKRYLEEFFKTAENYSEFEQYFEAHYLKTTYYGAKLMQGESIDKVSEIYTESQLEEIKEKRILKFLKSNKTRFASDEEVKVSLEIKNIPNLTINIFEINTENFYRKNMSQIDARIKLDGLLPAKQISIPFTEPPIIKFTKEFKFDSITERKRGIFVVEFIGGGLSSRAMIRKGSLTLVQQTTLKGVVFHIVNESKEICKNENTSIWLNNTLYKVNKEDGSITIPFQSSSINTNAIIIDQDFAELSKIIIPSKSIHFDCSLIFNQESLFPGCNARFILQPKLFCCNKLIPLSAIKKVKIEIEVVNERGVKNSRSFEDLTLSYTKDTVLTYMIPPKVRDIHIKIAGTYKGSSEEPEQVIRTQKDIRLNKFDGSDQYYNTYLKQSKEGYTVQFLGMNGEPYQDYNITINATSRYGSITGMQVNSELKTDENGEIHLGKLENVTRLQVTVKNSPGTTRPSSKSFILQHCERLNSLPSEFSIVEGEDLLLPASNLENPTEFDPIHYSLVKMDSTKSFIIGDYRTCIKNDNNQMISLSELKEGHYRLRFLNEHQQKVINITVHKGQRWELSNQYLITENSIIKLLSQSNYLVYRDLELNDDKFKVKILSNQPSTVKVHLLGFNHLTPIIENIKNSVKAFTAFESEEKFEFAKSENTYLSEKNLSDEIKYVLERKRKARYMGNTLDKPSSLLKRHFNKKTSAENEHLDIERDYSDMAGASRRTDAARRFGGATKGSAHLNLSVEQSNDFLKNQGLVLANLQPDDEGSIELTSSFLANYGTIMMVIEDSRSSIVEILANKEIEIGKKNITLANSKTANKVYLYERGVTKLSKGDVFELNDLKSTEMSMIEDRKTLFSMLKLLSGNSKINEWSFLEKWDSLDPEKQLQKYDKYISHEFNLFAYFRYPEFFELVVKEHLINKSEKQLIDYFLLGQYEKLEKYFKPYMMAECSMLEVSLLILAFRDTKRDQCEKILGMMKSMSNQLFWCIKSFKTMFDTVLTARKAEEEAEGRITGARVAGMMNNIGNIQNLDNMIMTQAIQAPMMQNFNLSNAYAAPQMMQQQVQFNDRRTMNRAGNYGGGRGRARRQRRNAPRMERANFRQDLALEQEMLYLDESRNYQQQQRIAPVKIEKFRTMGVTNEYVERQYYEGTTSQDFGEKSVKFWIDYIEHILNTPDKPFMSENFIYATSTLTEMLAVISLIELPEVKENHETSTEEGFKLTAASNCMIFCKAMKEKGNEKLDLDILISQRFFDPNDRYVTGQDGKSRMFKKIKEFLIGKLYGARIAITNSTESEHEVQIITEIPQGAIPVRTLEYSKSTTIKLDPLSTKILEFHFYFPAEGNFTCYPASITKDGYLISSASNIASIEVKTEQTQKEMNTISDVLTMGKKEDIIKFMKEQDLLNTDIFNFDSIYWLLKDKEFYEEVIALLRERFMFDPVVWSFSIYHGDMEVFKEYINFNFRNKKIKIEGFQISYLNNSLLKIDDFQFKEYNPLINPRVHDIGKHKQNILNRDFKTTYSDFLSYLVDKRTPTSRDYVYLGVYFLLQDRIEDSLKIYEKINSEDLEGHELKIQYDYLTAYLDLYSDYPNFTKARKICEDYLAYPVFTWRNRFIDLANQIAEFDGEISSIENAHTEDEKKQGKNNKEAEKSEYITAELENGEVKTTTKNVESFKISYYKIDLEIMFSQDPFISVGMADYSFVRANMTETIDIEKSTDYVTNLHKIPTQFANSNMLIQITCGAKTENLTYFPSSMKAFIVENYGQIKVTDESNKPLSKVYVKCFSKKKNGTVSFFKDGYTDLRGTFDYAALNLESITNIDKFALLVVSEDKGALIKQTNPPSSMSKVENKELQLRSTKMHAIKERMITKNRKSKKMNKWMY